MMMSPDEMQPMYSPQIINISNRELTDQEFPPLEPLERRALQNDQIYLIYDAMAIYLYVGRMSDPFFIYEIFKVNDVSMVEKQISEEEIFENAQDSTYLSALYNIVTQIRYQRQPYLEIRILLQGEAESEVLL